MAGKITITDPGPQGGLSISCSGGLTELDGTSSYQVTCGIYEFEAPEIHCGDATVSATFNEGHNDGGWSGVAQNLKPAAGGWYSVLAKLERLDTEGEPPWSWVYEDDARFEPVFAGE